MKKSVASLGWIFQNRKMFWDASTSQEILDEVHRGRDTAILPLGAIEQHGAHLVTGYDSWIAKRIATDLSKKVKAWVLPSFEFGTSDHHRGFHGTLTLRESTVMAMMQDLMQSLCESEIKRLILVNGHGGNYSWMRKLGNQFKGMRIVQDGDRPILFSVIRELEIEYPAAALGLHAGLFETSMALHTHTDAVRKNLMKAGLVPANPEKAWTDEEIRGFIAVGLKNSSPNGIIGDPSQASLELGRKFYDRVLERFLELVTESSYQSRSDT
ncbi:MAG: creatininase family protein [Bdellovibrionales bacterium]|nr:creatininase family protein [Bdellovibrionales bacterium]